MSSAMDERDRQILDIIQSDFPLCPRPYAELAQKLGMREEEVFEHVRKLRQEGVIRQLSANFWATKLGYTSTLCAAKVGEKEMEQFIALVNSYPNVTHNYLRAHAYNVWFTLICESKERAEAILEEITEKTGIPVLNLPAKKIFKIKVNFAMKKEA